MPKRKAPNNAYENTDRNKALRVVRDRALRAGDPELSLLLGSLSRGTRNRAVSRTAAMLVREKRAFQRMLLAEVPPPWNSGHAAHFAEVETAIRKAWRDPALSRSLDGAALGRALVMYAGRTGAEGIVKLLLAHPKVDVNARDHEGNTALYLATRQGCKGVVRALLAHSKIDVNARGGGSTALIWVALARNEGIVRLLLAHPKVDVNARDHEGNTALISAAVKGREDVVRLLLAHPKIDVNAKDRDGDTALVKAALQGHEEVVRLLIRAGARD